MVLTIAIAPHPRLEVGAFVTRFDRPLCEVIAQLDPGVHATPTADEGLDEAVSKGADDDVRTEIRQLLRHGGFKPAGRSKPASEYLVAAHAEGRWPRINAAVDACNIVSLRSGLPISVVDLDLLSGSLEIKVCPPGTSYVFNPSGQLIDASGLIALFDTEGPSGTPVKDAQRTKTHDTTRASLSIVWGSKQLPGKTHEATRWYRQLVASIPGTTIEDVALG